MFNLWVKDSLSACSRFMCTAHRHSMTLFRDALQKWQKTDAFGVIPSTAESPALLIGERFVLQTDLRRPAHFNTGSISARDSLSELFDWRVAASEHKHRFVLWSFKAPPRDAIFTSSLARVSDMFIRVLWHFCFLLLLPNWFDVLICYTGLFTRTRAILRRGSFGSLSGRICAPSGASLAQSEVWRLSRVITPLAILTAPCKSNSSGVSDGWWHLTCRLIF